MSKAYKNLKLFNFKIIFGGQYLFRMTLIKITFSDIMNHSIIYIL